MTLPESGWATVGPFFHLALVLREGHVLARADTMGTRARIRGRILDGAQAPVPDAMIEIWQANSHGRYRHPEDGRDPPLDPGFDGFGRTAADAEGRFTFDTILPGRVPGPGNLLQAPHINVSIFGRGLGRRLVTRLYFAGEPANAEDMLLDLIEPARRVTLLAQPDPAEPGTWNWTVHLQGPDETVFLSV